MVHRVRLALFGVSLLLVGGLWPFSQAHAFKAARVGFTIGFQGVASDLAIITGTAMPDGHVQFATTAKAIADKGTLEKTSAGWRWQAPAKPGLATLTFTQAGQTITAHMFVLTPWTNGKTKDLNGYKIGAYAKQPFRGLESYKAPTGFIEITAATQNIQISPHFTLGQFKCKQQPGHVPSYLLVHPGTLLKLERLLEAANKKGWHAETFTVMSGFRTPHYNHAIGNHTTSSRHLFGGAADIFIDADGDGQMDDLNGDGRSNKADAAALAKLAEGLAGTDPRAWPPGGLAPYAANAAHGPFVHVDVRGYRARWGR